MKIPKYRKQHGRDFAFVETKGRRHRLPGSYNSSESRRAYAEFLTEISLDQKPALATSKTTLLQLCSEFLDWAKANHKKKYDHYCRVVDVLKEGDIFWCRIDAIGPNAFRVMQQMFVDYRPKQKSMQRRPVERWSRQYVNTQMARLKRIFKWAVSIELVSPERLVALDTVDSLRRGRTDSPDANPVTAVDLSVVDRTIKFATPIVASMIRLQLITGMRPGNVCRICPGEIFDRTEKIWKFNPQSHKTQWCGGTLSIPLGPRSQSIISPYLDRPDDQPLFSPRESEASRWNGKKVTVSHRVRAAYDTSTYCHAVRATIRRANKLRCLIPIDYWTPNQLRHTVATNIRRQYGLEAAQVLLGHTRADVTQIYAERNLDLAIRVAADL